MSRNNVEILTKVANEGFDISDKKIAETILRGKINLKCKNHKQKEFSKMIDSNQITLCSGPAGVGKAQPIYSKILTNNGWIKMGDIKEGDVIYNDKMEKEKVININKQGIMDIFRITFDDGRYTDCVENHLWNIYNYDWSKKWKTIDTGDIIKYIKKKKNIYVPLLQDNRINDIQHNIDPYIMGVIIGDGCITQNRIQITSNDIEIPNKVNNLLVENYKINKNKSKYSYSLVMKNPTRKYKSRNNFYVNELYKLNLMGLKSKDKFIPNEYKNSSYNNKIKLITGLIDTDGYVGKNGTIHYYTSSYTLAKDFQYLIWSIGGICKLKNKFTIYKNEKTKSYFLSIRLRNPLILDLCKRKKDRLPKNYQYSDLKLKIKKVEKIEECESLCITTSSTNGLYITNDFVITHNSYISIVKALELLKNPKNSYKKIIIITPVVESEERIGYLKGSLSDKLDPYLYSTYYLIDKVIGEFNRKKLIELEIIRPLAIAYLRGINIDNSIVLFEEAQNSTKRGMKTFLTRIGYNTKFIISGDIEQIDRFKNVNESGLKDVLEKLDSVDDVGIMKFDNEDIVRNPLISKILDKY